MDIELFVKRRKELGLSQIELSSGICTQATLSRFENHGQIPSMKILSQLCARLHLEVGDLFASESSIDAEINQLLEQAESSLALMDYAQTAKLLKEITKDKLDDNQRMRYLYLKGYTHILQGKPQKDQLFYLNQLLAEQQHSDGRYLLLAYAGMGIVYQKEKDKKKAMYFFEKSVEEVEKYEIHSTADVWRVLMVLYYSALFFAEVKKYRMSNRLLRKGAEICSQYHMTYYIARIFFQLSINAMNDPHSKENVEELLHDASAFARMSNNHQMLKEIERFMEERVNEAEK